MVDKEAREIDISKLIDDIYYHRLTHEQILCYVQKIYKLLHQSQQDLKVAVEALEDIKAVDFTAGLNRANAFQTSAEAQIDLIKQLATQALAKFRKGE